MQRVLIVLPIFIIFIIFLVYFLYRFIRSIVVNIRNRNIRTLIIQITSAIVVLVCFKVLPNYLVASKLPINLTNDTKNYVMNLNEVKITDTGTKVKLGKVLIDIDRINFTLGVKGKYKVVAVEIRKDLMDEKPLKELPGMWLGGRFNYEFGGSGIPFESDTFIDPIYLVCHLSSGEEVSFKVEDKKDVKSHTEIIPINKTIDYRGGKLQFKTLIRGLNYTVLNVTADTNLFNNEAVLMQSGKEDLKTTGWSFGGGSSWAGGFSFKPIGVGDITIKLKESNTDKEYLVKVR